MEREGLEFSSYPDEELGQGRFESRSLPQNLLRDGISPKELQVLS